MRGVRREMKSRVGTVVMITTVACGGQRPAATSSHQAAHPAVDPNACPFDPLEIDVAVHSSHSLSDALAPISRSRYRSSSTDWCAREEGAVRLKTPAETSSETTAPRWSYHLLFTLPSQCILISELVTASEPKPNRCGTEVGDAVLDHRIVAASSGHKYGLVRIRRRDVVDSRDACDAQATFWIEDHVIDLGRGEHRRTIAQTYRGPRYKEVDPHVVALDKLSIAKHGIADQAISIDDPRCAVPFVLRR